MKEFGLVSKYVKRRKKNMELPTNKEVIENKVNRVFSGREALEVIVSDLTYVDINGKWCYICLIVELAHREIIGFAAGANKDSKLVEAALRSVKIDLRKVDIFHTDRGGEFKATSENPCKTK